MAHKFSKKDTGSKIIWLGKDDVVLTGKIVKVNRRIAKIEHRVTGRYETFTAYLDDSDERIVSVEAQP